MLLVLIIDLYFLKILTVIFYYCHIQYGKIFWKNSFKVSLATFLRTYTYDEG